MSRAARAVIVATARTPFGRLNGALASLTATTLGAAAIQGVLERSGIDPGAVDHVIIGQVLQGGVGQAPVRQALLKAGLAKTVTGETVNKVCASGLLAVAQAARLIRSGEAQVVLAGGMESMTAAPFLVQGARAGLKYGHTSFLDSVLLDGLQDAYLGLTMASAATMVAAELGPSREEQDAFAYESHRRAAAASQDGSFADEIIPLRVLTRERDRVLLPRALCAAVPRPGIEHEPSEMLRLNLAAFSPFKTDDAPHMLIERDEAIRMDASLAAMAALSPLEAGGSITAGNAPGLNDGAAMLIVADAAWAQEHGLAPLAEILGHATVAWDSAYLALTPALAAQKLLARHELAVDDITLWEINEAFAAVALLSAKRLGLDPRRINRRGGAIALGHPLGASGARIVASLAQQLQSAEGSFAVASICSGGGQGDALLLRRCEG